MKIALVSTHAIGEGGVPHYVALLARALAKSHEVTVYSSRFESFDGTGVRHRKIRAIGSGGMILRLIVPDREHSRDLGSPPQTSGRI